jgi:hypothetical protein
MKNIEELRGLLKTAGDRLKLAQEVIYGLAEQNQGLQHGISARDTAIKLASQGAISPADLSEKVAEFQEKTAEDLELENKVADYRGVSGHSLHSSSQAETTSAMSFLQS